MSFQSSNPIRASRRYVIALAALATSLISGCGSNPYADAVTASVTPSSMALLGPGPIAACADQEAYKASLASATGYVAMTYSVSGPAILFNNFHFVWASTDTLYVQELRVSINGGGLKTNPTLIQIAPQELEALLAVNGAIINPPADQGGSTPPATTTIDSSNGTARANSVFAACGLAIGPVMVNTNAGLFDAQLTFTIIGTAVDSNSNERFVEYQFTATAKYYGS